MKLSIGPGVIVAAAFIGPGTVTACTLAGANFGYALVWALVFATLATIVLQDMAARLGAGAGLGLGEALMLNAGSSWLKGLTLVLVFTALAIGNGAYEAGNLAGGALGLEAIFGNGAIDRRFFVLLLGLCAGAALYYGRYQLIERLLIILVMIMSVAFLASAVMVRPDFSALAAGLVPHFPVGGFLTAVALIGTTIVPYNLFLHASAARKRWPKTQDDNGANVAAARSDTVLSVSLGGLVSILVLTTAAGALFQSGIIVISAGDMARALEPVFGSAARYLLGLGLFAAGLTSAITAPLATAYALSEMLPAKTEMRRETLFRIISLTILGAGMSVSMLGLKPVSLILVAQAANGFLLPLMAIFLLVVMNRRSLLGVYTNGLWSNIAGFTVLAVTLGLGLRGILRAFGVWP